MKNMNSKDISHLVFGYGVPLIIQGWDPVNRFNHTSLVAVHKPTDRPKSVRIRCVIEICGGVFVLSCCFLDFS